VFQFDSDAEQKLNKAIEKGTDFLKDRLSTMESEYDIAITTYALSLAKSAAAKDAWKILKSKAKSQGGI